MLNRYKMENEQLRKLMFEKNFAVKIASTFLLDMEEKVSKTETENGLLSKSNAILFASASWKEAESTHTEVGFLLIYSFNELWICSSCSESLSGVLLQRGLQSCTVFF